MGSAAGSYQVCQRLLTIGAGEGGEEGSVRFNDGGEGWTHVLGWAGPAEVEAERRPTTWAVRMAERANLCGGRDVGEKVGEARGGGFETGVGRV